VRIRDARLFVRVRAPGIHLLLRAGDFAVAFGRDGAGMSALLFAIAGEPALPGATIEVLGTDATDAGPAARLTIRRHLGFVSRRMGLLGNLTIEENVALPIRYHTPLHDADMNERVGALMDRFELKAVRHRRPHEVDLLTRKCAALARASSLDPDILLADHPLDGLDSIAASRFLAVMAAETSGQGRLLLVATGDPGPWVRVGSRFVFFEAGGISWQGGPRDLEAAAHPMIRGFVSDAVRSSG
jgi:phospholipid/cholesterol/gamma-HCH transport system ATP-binding protein